MCLSVPCVLKQNPAPIYLMYILINFNGTSNRRDYTICIEFPCCELCTHVGGCVRVRVRVVSTFLLWDAPCNVLMCVDVTTCCSASKRIAEYAINLAAQRGAVRGGAVTLTAVHKVLFTAGQPHPTHTQSPGIGGIKVP